MALIILGSRAFISWGACDCSQKKLTLPWLLLPALRLLLLLLPLLLR